LVGAQGLGLGDLMRFYVGADLRFVVFSVAGEECGIEMIPFDQLPRFGREVFALTVNKAISRN